jgi:hypothetical protein
VRQPVSGTSGKAEPKLFRRAERKEATLRPPRRILAHPHRLIETATLRPERGLIYTPPVSIFHQARQHFAGCCSDVRFGWKADTRPGSLKVTCVKRKVNDLTGRAFPMGRVFLSYARDDVETARRKTASCRCQCWQSAARNPSVKASQTKSGSRRPTFVRSASAVPAIG